MINITFICLICIDFTAKYKINAFSLGSQGKLWHKMDCVYLKKKKYQKKIVSQAPLFSWWVTHLEGWYEGCSNMNASSFITFSTYMLRQNVIPFWKELLVAFKMSPNLKKHSLYVSSYRRLYKSHPCILKFFFWSKLPYTIWYMCGYSIISL